MATRLMLQLEDGRTVTAREVAWIQAILTALPEAVRAEVFTLAEQFDREQVSLVLPAANGGGGVGA